jgi:hydroxyacylglutathione hydrolase
MLLRLIYNDHLAQASYLLGCAATGEALVIDPNRDVEQYIALAQREGLRITHVTETHIHADFVSGARELARRTGARLLLSDMGPAEWKYAFAAEEDATLLREGDSFMVGNIRVEVLHTPGHTPEHLSFLVTDTAGADQPMGIFTGDFVFVGDVGRPDLLEKAAGISGTMEAGARALFRSVQRFKQLPDWLQVWPGHGAGSACGRALGAVPQSTVGYEKRFNWAFAIANEDTFVRAVLEGQPDPPPYFKHMKRINKEGPALLESLPEPGELAPAQLTEALADGWLVVDLRAPEDFAAGHVPGTFNLPLNSAFLTWAGWLLPYDRPFGLLGDHEAVARAVRLLRLIGLDQAQGYWTPAVLNAWTPGLATLELLNATELQRRLAQGQAQIVDVRNHDEYARGHIAGSRHIPLGTLPQQLGELPREQPIVVVCQSGARSAIGASLLRAAGYGRVASLVGGMNTWQTAGLPVEQGAPVTGEVGVAPSYA